MSSLNYGKAAKKFADAGISPKWLLPIAPVNATIAKNTDLNPKVLGKAPGRYNPKAKTWSGLGGSYIVTGVRQEEFEDMQDWPTNNVGILGKAFPGIDSDAVDGKARNLIERVLSQVFGNAVYGERTRGKGPRALYAFKAYNPKDPESVVRTRHITYRMQHQDADAPSNKLDIIGLGGQYVIAGTHPSGDEYSWMDIGDLRNPEIVDQLEEIDNADIERFIEAFETALEKEGGKIVHASGGSRSGEEYDLKKLEPILPVDAILEGLARIPNTEDNFPHRDDFVSMLAMVRAALGKRSFEGAIEDKIREWATEDYDWCDDEYFDKAWNSLDRVRVNQNAIDRVFKANGYMGHVKHSFADDADDVSTKIDKNKKMRKSDSDKLLDMIAERYIFGRINAREGKSLVAMRDVWDVDHDWHAIYWYKGELQESRPELLAELHAVWGDSKIGFANFLRDLQSRHPDIWYSSEVKNPNYDRGTIVTETYADGSKTRALNMRRISDTIREARKPPKNAEQSARDLRHILDFINRLFGSSAKYELDTLAFMAQTGDRPGHLLMMVGDPGVGKSIYLDLLTTMFDGVGPEINSRLDGAKLLNESARRFMLVQAEGSRIVTIRELPENSANATQIAAITSLFKQIVDPGREADYITVEGKGTNFRPQRNFMRVLLSSNYRDALHVEANDRRIFYVLAGINEANKPDEDYYGHLVDIVQDPKRLATFWRYLLTRDVADYTRYTAPPETEAKREQIAIDAPTPLDRHFLAALELLRVYNRRIFTTTELREIMSEMSENEYKNSRGEIDDRKKYHDVNDKVTMMVISKKITKKIARKINIVMRTNKARMPVTYVFPGSNALADKIEDFNDREYLQTEIDKDAAKHELGQHPWAVFKYVD